ncbi:Ig-like domain-containing protein [Zhihengliuella somnathii]
MASTPRAQAWPAFLRTAGFKATAVSAVTALAVTGAVLYPGFETADVELNDGGVWVVNRSEGKIGHVNYQSRVLDGGVVTPLSDYDLAQHGESVFVRNMEQASLTTIDPAMVQFAGDSNLPANSSFSFGASVVAVTDAERGTVQATPIEFLSGFSGESAEPLIESEGDVAAAVGRDDTVWAADFRAGMITSFEFDDEGTAQPVDEFELPALSDLAEPQLTAVGDTAVVFDPTSGRVITTDGGDTTVENPANGRVQAPGPEHDDVAIALGQTLATVSLGGRDINYEQLDTSGTPIQPVRVGHCTYGAWQVSGEYRRVCDDVANNQAMTIPEMDTAGELEFRVNRDVVVLNDINSGQVWLANEGMEIVSNWSDLEPPAGEGEAKEEETKEITEAVELPNRTEENVEPIAEDDIFKVRPGKTTLLPVLYNDVDPDGDLLTAKLEGAEPSIGELQPVHNGTGYQLVVDDDASGAATFTYSVDDGRGGTDSATVSLQVVGEEENEAPEQDRVTVLRVQQGESVAQNVLTDWTDPEGDELQLLGGTSDGDDIIRAQADGTLTFQDDGKRIGQKEVSIQVSDGQESTSGRVLVEVLAESTVPPVTSTDHVVATVDEPTVFEPLANDRDPSGDGLRLASVNEVPGLEIVENNETGSVTVTGERAGTFYTEYVATNGPASTPGLVRIDVEEAADATADPIAVRDTALLPAGEDVLVNVLGNDEDPAGGVLVVTAAENDTELPFSVSIERNGFVRITDVRGLTDQALVEYTVSNGHGEATGEIVVNPVPAPPRMDPPQANPDTVSVRAGDVATVKVLENDIHPNGGDLTLLPELSETDDLGEGSLISVADEAIRFRAGAFDGNADQVSAVYTIAGPDGQEDSATVTFNIQPEADEADLESNTPPVPEPVEGRVFAGSSTNVVVPLDAIDADGDSVSLVQFGDSPKHGTAKIRGASIDYTAHEDASGTDEFTYVVEDRLGARATGTIKIGIAPLAEANNPPVAVNDFITVRPERPVAVDVLNNDTDPDGDPVSLMPEVTSEATADVEVVDGRVVLTSAPDDGTISVRYTVTDGRGGTGRGTLTVASDPEAKLLAPIARDDRVSLEEIIDSEDVTVDILRNDEDPDGFVDELEVSLPDNPEGVSVTEDGLNIPVRATSQVIAYTLTDVDGLTSTAFVHVPGTGEAVPMLVSDLGLEVTAGETLPIDLEEIVLVRDGRSPRLTTEDKVQSAPASTSDLVASATELEFTAPTDFAGSASVTFEVTDGSGPDDPEGLTSVLTAPINVLPAPGNTPDDANEGEGAEGDPEEEEEQPDPENFPPTLQANSLRVGQGEEPALMDLRLAASDQNEDDVPNLKFAIEEVAMEGVNADLVDGHTLRVEAPADTPKGSTGTITVSVSDGVNPKVTAPMSVTVTGSTRELAVANADRVPDAAQGQTSVVDVLANDHNPYAGEGDLRLISARTLQDSRHEVEVRGDQVAITPHDDFVGTMRVEYVIGDMTQDPERNVSGTVTLNVRGAPEAPGLPRVESTGDEQAVLSWDPPADNGEEITHYTVTGGGHEQQCKTTTCTITNLTNDKIYNFVVTATNAIGTSEPSPESADARPDVRPERPKAPTGTDGDKKATFKWTAPESRGSAIQSYTLEISPAPADGRTQVTGITGTNYTWEGLKNGTAYQVRVRAVNKADRPSQWSPYSGAVTPAGKPFKPDAPTASRAESEIDGGVVNVAWKAPGANGAAINGYTLRVWESGSVARTITGISGDTTRQTVTGLSTTGSYRFTIQAHNRVGASAQSNQSVAVTPYGRPKTIGNVSASATGSSGDIKLDFSKPGSNGSTITGYQYSMDGGSWNSFSGPGGVVDVGSNGDSHSFRVRAVNAAGAGRASEPSNSESAYRSLRDNANLKKASGKGYVEFWWNTDAGEYNGRSVTQTVTVNGNSKSNSGHWKKTGLGYSESKTIKIVARDSEGQSRSWSTTAKTDPKPARKVTVQWHQYSGKYCGNCWQVEVKIYNFSPHTSYNIACYSQNGRFRDYARAISTNGDGYGRAVPSCEIDRNYADPFYVKVDGTKSNELRK